MSEVAQQPSTEIATLPPAERAQHVLASSKAEVQLRELIKESAEITAVASKDDRELAHRIGMKLKTARTSIEKVGKAAREDAQAFSKAVIEEEKRLKAITAAEEDRIFKLRDEYDAKVAAEKAEAERIERERVTAIRVRIDGIRALPLQSANDKAGEIELTLADLKALDISEEVYAEFTQEAAQVRQQVMGELRTLADAVRARETAEAALEEERQRIKAEAERLAAERAELERMRAEIEAAKKAQEAPAPAVETGITIPADATIVEDGTPGATTVQANGATVSYVLATSPGVDEIGIVPASVFGENQTIDSPEVAESKNHSARAMLDDVSAEAPDADTLVSELAGYTAMQFMAMAKKVAAVAENSDKNMKAALMAFASELSNTAAQVAAGEFNEDIKAGNWLAMAEADKEMALASHACVSLIVGDNEMGASVLRGVAA